MTSERAEAVYLDNNATTRPDPRVVEAMLPLLGERFHNPSSPYPQASAVADAIGRARASVARLVGARRPSEIVFTSGGSESIHAAFFAASEQLRSRPRIVTTAVEHSAVKAAAEAARQRQGQAAGPECELDILPVDRDGRLDPEALRAAITPATGLVSLMLANNETGVITDLAGAGAACREAGALLHIDLVQGPGKLVLDVEALGADYASIAAHKFHGPKGIGALYVRHGAPLQPLFPGGPQESERRAGTENTAGIAGLGVAAEIAAERAADGEALGRLQALRDRFETAVLEAVPGARVHGAGSPRLPNTCNLALPAGEASLTLALLADSGVLASAGSACNAGSRAPSPVLLAMGTDPDEASRSLRFSLSHETTQDEIEHAVRAVAQTCATVKALG